jgi:sucrose phosphorylase
VGLLAGENDIDLVEKTRLGRNINRHNYSLEEIKQDIQKPVVKRLLRLMEFRNSYPAFNGKLNVLKSNMDKLILNWVQKKYQATAYIDLNNFSVKITYSDPVAVRNVDFIA